jgi:hypothetical protein
MSDASKDLTINFHFRKQAAEAASKAYHEGEKQRIAKTLSDAKAAEREAAKAKKEAAAAAAKDAAEVNRKVAQEARELQKTIAREHREAVRAKTALDREAAADAQRLAKQTAAYEAKVASEASAARKQAMKAEAAAAAELSRVRRKDYKEADALLQAHMHGLSMVPGKLTAIVGGLSAMAIGRKIFSDITAGAQESAREIAAMADEFLKLRDRGRELAGIMGDKPNNKFTLDQLRFGAITGQTGDEAKQFRTAFQGEVQQYKGKFAPGEFAKYEQELAKLQVKEDLTPDVAGRLGGVGVFGLPKGAKNVTAAQAMKAVQQGFATLQGGSGSNQVISNAFAEVASQGVGPDQLFRDTNEVAVAIRALAPSGAGEAAMRIQNIRRGFQELDEDQEKKLGITGDMNYFQKMDAINAAFKKSGEKDLGKWLAKNGFKDSRMNFGMVAHINQGIEGGLVSEGFKDTTKFTPEQFATQTAEFYADTEQSGSLRVEQAKKEVVKAQLARDEVRIASLKLEADRQTLNARTRPRSKIEQYISQMLPQGIVSGLGGFKDMDEVIRYDKAIELAEERAKQAGVPTRNFRANAWGGTIQFEHEGKPATDAYLAKLVEATEESNRLLQKQLQQGDKPRPLRNGAPNQPPAHP